jgi:hypothetical protein
VEGAWRRGGGVADAACVRGGVGGGGLQKGRRRMRRPGLCGGVARGEVWRRTTMTCLPIVALGAAAGHVSYALGFCVGKEGRRRDDGEACEARRV